MEIKFTKKQYEDLIKMVYLGNWMINSVRFDNIVKKYDEIEQHIYSFAKDAGLDKYIEFNSKLNRFFPTIEFEDDEEIDEYIEEYDNAYFWDDLVSSLSSNNLSSTIHLSLRSFIPVSIISYSKNPSAIFSSFSPESLKFASSSKSTSTLLAKSLITSCD